MMGFLYSIKKWFTMEDLVDKNAPVPSVREIITKQSYDKELHKSIIARRNRIALHKHMDDNKGMPLNQTLRTFVPEPDTK